MCLCFHEKCALWNSRRIYYVKIINNCVFNVESKYIIPCQNLPNEMCTTFVKCIVSVQKIFYQKIVTALALLLMVGTR